MCLDGYSCVLGGNSISFTLFHRIPTPIFLSSQQISSINFAVIKPKHICYKNSRVFLVSSQVFSCFRIWFCVRKISCSLYVCDITLIHVSEFCRTSLKFQYGKHFILFSWGLYRQLHSPYSRSFYVSFMMLSRSLNAIR